MTTGIDGLVSGLDTTSLINSLMQAEAGPQTLLKNKVTSTNSLVTALQTLNSKFASMTDLATAAAKPTSLNLFTATSSSAGVTVTAGPTAAAGSIDVVVNALAKSQVLVTGAMTSWPSSPATLTIVGASGTQTEISAASSSLDDVVTAINTSGAGVSALKVAAGTDPVTGTDQYRLQLSSTTTGADSAFTLYQGSAAEVTAGTATDVASLAGSAVISTAQDARITLWAGTAAEQSVTSATNTFADLLPGVTATVGTVSADPVTVTIARDSAAATKVASTFVDKLNDIFAFVAAQTATTTSTDSSTGASTVSGGTLSGESSVRDATQSLLNAASAPINGRSPSEIGITITKDGNFTFDADAFAAAMAADPAKVESMLQGIATNVGTVATAISDKYTGTLTTTITGQQSVVKDLNTQISDWDSRLADRRATLEKTYAALEVSLSGLQSQSSWLTGQISSLPKWPS